MKLRAFTLWMLGADLAGKFGRWEQRIKLHKNSLDFLMTPEVTALEINAISRGIKTELYQGYFDKYQIT